MKKGFKLLLLCALLSALFLLAALTVSAQFDAVKQGETVYYYEISYTDSGNARQVRGYATTLSDAVANAAAGDTVTLLANATERAAVTIDKDITLHGNGYTVDFGALTGRLITVDSAAVTVKSVTLQATDVTAPEDPLIATTVIYVQGSAALTLEEVSIHGGTNADGNVLAGGYYAVYLSGNEAATLTVTGGTYFAYGRTIYVTGQSTAVIHSGKFLYSAMLDYPAAVQASGTANVTLQGGYYGYVDCDPAQLTTTPANVYGKKVGHVVLAYGTSEVTIKDGTYYCGNGAGIIYTSGTHPRVTVTGGSFYGYSWIRLANSQTNGTINVYGGAFYSNPGQDNCIGFLLQATTTCNIYGGSFWLRGNASDACGLIAMSKSAQTVTNVYGGTFHDASTNADHGLIRITVPGSHLTVHPAGTDITDAAGTPARSSGAVFNKTGGGYLVRLTFSATVDLKGGTYNLDGSIALFRITGDTAVAKLDNATVTLKNGAHMLNQTKGTFTADGSTVYIEDGGILPADDAKWAGCNFVILGAVGSVTLESGDTVRFDSEATAIAEAQRIFLKQYSSNRYIKIGENLTAEGITTLTPFTVNGGTLYISGGSYRVSARLLYLKSGTVNVTGGSFTRVGAGSIFEVAGGSLTISGKDTAIVGEGFGKNSALIYTAGGTLTVDEATLRLTNGGSILSLNGNADVTVNGGSFLKDNNKSAYYQGAIFYFSSTGTKATLTVTGGTFTAASMIRIYAECTSATESGARATVTGGTFIDNARSGIHTDHRYLFQVARCGKHTIELKDDVQVTATAHTFIFNCNASAEGAVFSIDGGSYEGGRAWVVTNREYTTISIKNATFKDVNGNMSGASGTTRSAIYCDVDTYASIAIENTTFLLKTPTAILFKWDGQADFSITDSRVVAPQLLYATAAKSFAVSNSLFVITGDEGTVFDNASTTLENTVVLAKKGVSVFGRYLLTAHAADVTYAGTAYKSFVTANATGEHAPVRLDGAALLVDTATKETSGLRFESSVSAEALAALRANEKYANADFAYYTLIAPADYVAAARAFTKEALDRLGCAVPYLVIPAVNSLKVNGDVSFSGTLVNLKSNTRAYAAVSYIEITDAAGNVIDTLYSAYNSDQHARTAEQVADTVIFEKEELEDMNAAQQDLVRDYANGVANELEGKRIIFIGDSFVYYGQTVLEKSQSILSQTAREGDKGYFYQLCRANGVTVSVTNWTLGGHGLSNHCSESCAADRGCDGENHLSYLVDRDYDYVVISGGRGSSTTAESHFACIEKLVGIFREVNPHVKFLYLVSSGAHNVSVNPTLPVNILNNLDVLEDDYGFTIVDWGAIVADIVNGKVSVPGATQSFNKNSFAVHWSATDGYHPNQLAGYITSLMTYCAITGESAVGQTYEFWNDTSLKPAGQKDYFFDADAFVEKYYTKGETNYPDVFDSPADMLGLQQLIDKYLAEKAYRDYNFEPLG